MEKIINTERPGYSSTTNSIGLGYGDRMTRHLTAMAAVRQDAEQSEDQGWTQAHLDAAEKYCTERGWTVEMQIGGRSGLVLSTDLTGDAYEQALIALADHIGASYVLAGGARRIVSDPSHAMSANSVLLYIDGEMLKIK